MRASQSGISLIETLVVIGIVGLLASLVVVTLPPGASDSQKMEAIAASLRRAARLSVLSGEPIALAVGPDGQRFERYVNRGWQRLSDLPWSADDAVELTGPERTDHGVVRLIFTPGGWSSGGEIRRGNAHIRVGKDSSISMTGETP